MDYVSRASRFCEIVRQTGIAQPANSWSCAAFLVVSLWVVKRTNREELNNDFAANWGYFYAAVVALIGLGSFWNHAALSRAGGTADVEGMFLLVSFLSLYALHRLVGLSRTWLISLLVLANIPLTYIASLPGPITDYVFALLVVAVIGLELLVQLSHRYQAKNSYFWLGFFVLAIAFGVWQLDIRGIWCNPNSLIQGHALWHILTAIVPGILYLYYSSESVRTAVISGEL